MVDFSVVINGDISLAFVDTLISAVFLPNCFAVSDDFVESASRAAGVARNDVDFCCDRCEKLFVKLSASVTSEDIGVVVLQKTRHY